MTLCWPSSSQVCTLLASCLWLHSSSSTTRSVPQLMLIIQTVGVSAWTVSDTSSPPLCLGQLRSVSHLQGAVLMYRVSVKTFHWLIPAACTSFPLNCPWGLDVVDKFILSLFLPVLSLPGSEHADLRSVLLCLPFLRVCIHLLASSTFVLQRWAPLLPLPVPAMVGQSTHNTTKHAEPPRLKHC